ncbi:MAG: MAPEG family protein [Alphaproteobacteria bacterium]|jgi:uncharacterized MAPEG superfamily protein|nr:MAPEG family protein [Alphaproteobacteria bacterium]
MSIEFTLLLWAAALAVIQTVIAAIGAITQVGLPTLAGNREPMPELTGWVGRANRSHRNMLESLVLFAILVLVAQAMGTTNEMTVLGAQLFFWARVAYVPIYIIGLPWIRTGAWAVSLLGLVLIFLQLI